MLIYFILMLLCPSIIATFQYLRCTNEKISTKRYISILIGNALCSIAFSVFYLFFRNLSNPHNLSKGLTIGEYIFVLPVISLLVYYVPSSLILNRKWGLRLFKLILFTFPLLLTSKQYKIGNLFSENKSLYIKWVLLYISILTICMFPEKLRKLLQKATFLSFSFIAFTPLITFYILERLCNPQLNEMKLSIAIVNLSFFYLVFIVLYNLFRNKKIILMLFYLITFFIGTLEYYVVKFRAIAIMPSDLTAVGTALQVSGGYHFDFDNIILDIFTVLFLCLTIIMVLPYPKIAKKQMKYIRTFSISSICILSMLFSTISIKQKHGITLNYWWPTTTYYENGFVVSFLSFLQDMKITKPENYSEKHVEKILQETTTNTKNTESSQQPTVIAIMNETFSDLGVVSDFDCKPEVLSYWNSIDDYIAKGNLFVSTYAGGTCNTEFEFLTGNSMGNLPIGVTPYQQYSTVNMPNLAKIFKDSGYETIAIHPESEYNWGRNKVYKNFGFNKFLSHDSFSDSTRIRNFVSDISCYDKIIEQFETKNGPAFIFNVTMQNHGGYDINTIDDLKKVQIEEKYEEYEDVITYLSLIKESDKAIKYLLDYFSKVDEPVIICLFGDHQPGINGDFVNELYGKPQDQLTLEELQRQYMVPYLVWSNEDNLSGETIDMSSNYLGAYLLNQTGLAGNAYTQYLNNLRTEIPIINKFGYMENDAIWHSFDETTAGSSFVQDYKILQYNLMFDNKNAAIYKTIH